MMTLLMNILVSVFFFWLGIKFSVLGVNTLSEQHTGKNFKELINSYKEDNI